MENHFPNDLVKYVLTPYLEEFYIVYYSPSPLITDDNEPSNIGKGYRYAVLTTEDKIKTFCKNLNLVANVRAYNNKLRYNYKYVKVTLSKDVEDLFDKYIYLKNIDKIYHGARSNNKYFTTYDTTRRKSI